MSERRWRGLHIPSKPEWWDPEWAASQVLYLGVAKVGRDEAECYWWSIGVGGGSFYAYFGDGEGDYACSQLSFCRAHYGYWEPLFKLLEAGKGMDETAKRLNPPVQAGQR